MSMRRVIAEGASLVWRVERDEVAREGGLYRDLGGLVVPYPPRQGMMFGS